MSDSIRRWLNARNLGRLGSIGLGVLCLILVARMFVDRSPPAVRMSAGPRGTQRHAVANYLVDQAARHDLAINLQSNAGSEESLNQLKAGQLDAAIVSNGVVVPDDDEIVVLGAIQLEPVHLLVSKAMAQEGPLLESVRGKRVNLGAKGSTEWLLSREFLAFARLELPSATHRGDIIPTEYRKEELLAKAHAILQADASERETLIAELPDCLLVLASMPSIVVQQLVEAAEYEIVPLPATRAFLLNNLQDDNARTTLVEREFLERAVIPAHSYFGQGSYPEKDCETLGMRLLVVARKELPAEAVRPLMETVYEGEFSRRIEPRSPRDLATPYVIHPAAIDYLDRDKPLALAAAMDWLSEALSIFGAFSAGALSLYGLLRRRRARKPANYFAEIRRIEQLASGMNVEEEIPTHPGERASYLQGRLVGLRQELIEDICEGRIKGDQVIANILSLINDTRRNAHKLNETPAELRSRMLREYLPAKKTA